MARSCGRAAHGSCRIPPPSDRAGDPRGPAARAIPRNRNGRVGGPCNVPPAVTRRVGLWSWSPDRHGRRPRLPTLPLYLRRRRFRASANGPATPLGTAGAGPAQRCSDERRRGRHAAQARPRAADAHRQPRARPGGGFARSGERRVRCRRHCPEVRGFAVAASPGQRLHALNQQQQQQQRRRRWRWRRWRAFLCDRHGCDCAPLLPRLHAGVARSGVSGECRSSDPGSVFARDGGR
mmetsp:Transcript_4402/g.18675  ORF Transcript_4402/g.18675 Transcript_4402/m.18675 type:complete len:236 (-) Transcript_4402:621-1328(-)